MRPVDAETSSPVLPRSGVRLEVETKDTHCGSSCGVPETECGGYRSEQSARIRRTGVYAPAGAPGPPTRPVQHTPTTARRASSKYFDPISFGWAQPDLVSGGEHDMADASGAPGATRPGACGDSESEAPPGRARRRPGSAAGGPVAAIVNPAWGSRDPG